MVKTELYGLVYLNHPRVPINGNCWTHCMICEDPEVSPNWETFFVCQWQYRLSHVKIQRLFSTRRSFVSVSDNGTASDMWSTWSKMSWWSPVFRKTETRSLHDTRHASRLAAKPNLSENGWQAACCKQDVSVEGCGACDVCSLISLP